MGFVLNTGMPIANVIVPKGGPKTVRADLDFSNAAAIDIDGEQVVAQGQIEYLQGCFIDNSSNVDAFRLEMQGTNQVIAVPPNSQGYYPILCQNPPKMTAKTTQQNGRIVPVHFYNVPIQAATWKTV